VFSAELAFSDLSAFDVNSLEFVLKSIAWAISIPPDSALWAARIQKTPEGCSGVAFI
jgi:hypothetical protein